MLHKSKYMFVFFSGTQHLISRKTFSPLCSVQPRNKRAMSSAAVCLWCCSKVSQSWWLNGSTSHASLEPSRSDRCHAICNSVCKWCSIWIHSMDCWMYDIFQLQRWSFNIYSTLMHSFQCIFMILFPLCFYMDVFCCNVQENKSVLPLPFFFSCFSFQIFCV